MPTHLPFIVLALPSPRDETVLQPGREGVNEEASAEEEIILNALLYFRNGRQNRRGALTFGS